MLDLTDLCREKGRTAAYSVTPELETLSYRFGSFPVIEKEPARFQIENLGDGKIRIGGSAAVTVRIPCARCLEPVRFRLEMEPELEIALDDSAYIREKYFLDTDLMIHDEALLIWPEQVLCCSDCKGLCKKCGANLNLGPCSCDQTVLDPRMAKVLDIFNNYKEV